MSEQRPRVRPSIGPLPGSPAAQIRDALQRLQNILDYSVAPPRSDLHTLETLRAVTPTYIKAISRTRKTEFYFPVKMERTRDGALLRVLSVLRREDKLSSIKWDADGLPVTNAKLIDDMRDCRGKTWRYGVRQCEADLIFTLKNPGL